MSDTASAVKQIFDEMPRRLNTGATAGLDAVIQYQLTGEGGGKYYTHIQETTCVVQEGEHATPRMTVIMEAIDFVDMTPSGGTLVMIWDTTVAMGAFTVAQ